MVFLFCHDVADPPLPNALAGCDGISNPVLANESLRSDTAWGCGRCGAGSRGTRPQGLQ